MIIREKLKKYGVPLLAGIVILGGMAVVKASASSQQIAQPVKQEAGEQAPVYKASIILEQQDNGKDENQDKTTEEKDDAALVAKAKISSNDEAVNAVKAAYPENTVQSAAIEDENGNLVYEVKMSDNSAKTFDVKVDAGNAELLAVEEDSEENEGITEDKDIDSQQDEQKDSAGEKDQGPDNDNVELEQEGENVE